MKLPKQFTQDKVDLLKELYPEASKEKILTNFPNYGWRSVQNIANILNIKRIACSIRKGNLKKLLEGKLIDYYIFGLILSDGYISKDGTLKIDLCNTDQNYLKYLSDYLETSLKLYPRYKGSLKNSKGICRLKIKDVNNGVKIREFLGIGDIKTYDGFTLDFIKHKYHLVSFLAGFIDGDGSINHSGNIYIDCHINLKNIFIQIGDLLRYYSIITNYKIVEYEQMVRICFSQKDSYNIYMFLKKLKLPIMNRKWDRIKIPIHNLINSKSIIKKLRKRNFNYNKICKILGYKSVGSFYQFCKRNKI